MHDLRLVGVHDDGEHLLLVDDQGERHLLAVDDALRAAVRRDRAHLGQLQLETQGGLRPRDVQSRIRAGATREEVAALAGWSVEKVRRYEGPVLAERAHVADRARRVRLRRRGGEPVLLGDEVTNRMRDRGVDERTVLWDSWRTEGGPWTVVVHFTAGGSSISVGSSSRGSGWGRRRRAGCLEPGTPAGSSSGTAVRAVTASDGTPRPGSRRRERMAVTRSMDAPSRGADGPTPPSASMS